MVSLQEICHQACKVKLTAAELQNTANKICKLKKQEEIDVDSEKAKGESSAFRELMLYMYNTARVPSLRREVEGSFQPSDFSVDEGLVLETFKLLTLFQIHFQSNDGPVQVLSYKDKHVFGTISVILIYEHANMEKPWSTTATHTAAQVLLAKMCQLFDSPSISGVLDCNNEQVNTLFRDILLLLKNNLAQQNWKKNPASMSCFNSLLQVVSSSQVSECLPEVFPPVLLLLDDFEIDNKISGVQCAQNVIDKSSKTELRWYSRADVLYSAVKHLLHNQDDRLLSILLPCLLSLSQIIDSGIPKGHMQQSTLDELFQTYLTNMDFESKWCNRRIYALHLGNWISALGIGTVKHFYRLFKVLDNYLEVVDYPEEKTRLDILSAVQILIKITWPRIQRYIPPLTKTLMRILIDFAEDDSMINTDSRQLVISNINSVVQLLGKVDKKLVLEIMDLVLEINDLPDESRRSICDIQTTIRSI